MRSIVSLLVSLALVACDRTPPPPPEALAELASADLSRDRVNASIRVSGSSALQPLVNAAKERYEVMHPGISVEVSAGGSKKGIADVASGAVHVGASDIFAPDDLRGVLEDHRVAVVGFAAMAHKGPYNEGVRALSLGQLAKVFSGQIRNWSELGGKPQPIVVINRAPGSGTRTIFGRIVLGGDHFLEAMTEDNSGALVDKLKQTSGAISYLALSFKTDALRVLALETDGGPVEASEANIVTGRYPIWAYEHLYTKGEASGATEDFLDYVLSEDFQRKVVPTVRGFIPVLAMQVQKSVD